MRPKDGKHSHINADYACTLLIVYLDFMSSRAMRSCVTSDRVLNPPPFIKMDRNLEAELLSVCTTVSCIVMKMMIIITMQRNIIKSIDVCERFYIPFLATSGLVAVNRLNIMDM